MTEYAKEKVWEGSLSILDDQLYLIAKTFHRLFRLIGKVDVAVFDSPFILSWYYNNKELSKGRMGECLEELTGCCYEYFENYNFFIVREKKFNPKGRVQGEEESKNIDTFLVDIMQKKNIQYTTIKGNKQATDIITEIMLEKLNRKE